MALSNALPNSIVQPGVCTSSTRPSNPYEGQFIYETDTDSLLFYNGSSWVIPGSSTSPSSANDFTRKGYVDSQISTVTSAASTAQATANNASSAASSANNNANARIARSGDTMSGNLNLGSNTLYLKAGDPYHGLKYLYVQNQFDGAQLWGWGGVRISVFSDGEKNFSFKYDGNASAPGTWFDNSSIRYKKNIRDIKSFDGIDNIRPVIYSYKDDTKNKDNFGFIAEEIAEVYPELVEYDEDGNPDGVAYSRFTVLAISEIKNLRKRLSDLEDKVNELVK